MFILKLTDKNNVDLKEGDIILHNGNRYVLWITDNFGVVAISENSFDKNDKILRVKQNHRDFHWIQNVKKYIEIVDSIYN
jgi:hypothetical protein